MLFDSFEEVFSSKERILMVFAHPDDMEINCGGVAARLCDAGKAVRLVSVTAGESGVRDADVDQRRFRQRRIEAFEEAAQVLGISKSEVFCLNIDDGRVENTIENIGLIVAHIRAFRPDIVITHNPAGYLHTVDGSYYYISHRDHRNTATLAIDAVYPYSRDWAFFPEHRDAGLDGHVVHEMLIGDVFEEKSARAFDISRYVQLKSEALRIHMVAGAMDEAEHESYSNEGKTEQGFFEILLWWRDIH